MYFKNLSIRTKLILALLIPFILMTFIVLINYVGLSNSKQSFEDYLNGANKTLQSTQETRIKVINLARILRDAVIEVDRVKVLDKINQSNDLEKQIQSDITNIDKFFDFKTASDREIVKAYQQSVNDWLKIGSRVKSAISSNNNDLATNILLNECAIALDKVDTTGTNFKDLVSRISNESSSGVASSISTINFITIVLLIIVFCTSVFFGFVALRTLMVPVRALISFTNEIRKGNLHAEYTYKSTNEMGKLSDCIVETIKNWNAYINEITLNLGKISEGDVNVKMDLEYAGDFANIKTSIETIGDSLNKTMYQIKVSSDQVAVGSEQVASASQSLAQGSTEQASAVEDLASSILVISEQVKANAENAKSVNDMVGNIGAKINESNEQMNNMMNAIELITQKSNEINKIIKTIEDIAFNTNILALNAAVEAARAGNAGKGFAVVADEVRNLASKSSEAAKNTTALINDSISAVENGTAIAKSTAESLTQVVEGAHQISSIINDIAKASEDQAVFVSQINTGIEQISSVVQTNSATSEESAAASQQLSSQANMLKYLVNKFKLRQDNNDNLYYSSNSNEDNLFDDFNVISKY